VTTWLRVKNWREHQHYGKRRPPWIKLHRAMLDDYAVAALPDVAKAHLTGIWLLAVAEDGRVPNDPTWIARKINATEPVDLQPFIRAGLLVPEGDASTTLATDASVPVQSTLEQGRDRGRGREETEAEAGAARHGGASTTTVASDADTEATIGLLPPDYRPDLRDALRGCHRPEALLREIRTLCGGGHPQAEGATPADVGQGLRELVLNGRSLNALPRWVAPLVKRRREAERTERAKSEERAHTRRKREEQVSGERGGPLTPLTDLLPKLGIVPDRGAA